MEEQQHHEKLIKGITEQLKPVMDKSEQAIYVYLDDTHKACNKKMAELLGYKSAKEWADAEAPLSDVVEKDRDAVVTAYVNATEKMLASTTDISVKNVKTGKPIKTRMIMVPVAQEGHVFSLHFISRI